MIGIIDYGMGNLHSVTKALERLGHTPFLSENHDELSKASMLILPGVGSFKDGIVEKTRTLYVYSAMGQRQQASIRHLSRHAVVI